MVHVCYNSNVMLLAEVLCIRTILSMVYSWELLSPYWLTPLFPFLQPCFITWVPWRWSRDTFRSRKSIWFFGTIKWFTCLFSKEQNRSLNERAAISDISIMYIEINDAASRKWVSLLADQRASYVDRRSCNEGKNWLLCNGKEKATVTETI